MSAVLQVQNLCKEYPLFRLENVSFSIDKPEIMGFIGRNGAGKTTTLKSLLNLVHPTSGTITFWNMNLSSHETQIKQRVGYAAGQTSYYQRKKIREIADITKMFYPNWDDKQYRRYLDQFALDENKKLTELSEGMKVKFSLALALSHHAELLILDEPTSGLDPVSREELLEQFMDIADEGTAILFSTHIISDLEKCADEITYIQNGKILASEGLTTFQDRYRLVELDSETSDNADTLSETQRDKMLGIRRSRKCRTALINKDDASVFDPLPVSMPDLEAIMSHLEADKK
jgi:ABC-2 type transport system ATP-binding protein